MKVSASPPLWVVHLSFTGLWLFYFGPWLFGLTPPTDSSVEPRAFLFGLGLSQVTLLGLGVVLLKAMPLGTDGLRNTLKAPKWDKMLAACLGFTCLSLALGSIIDLTQLDQFGGVVSESHQLFEKVDGELRLALAIVVGIIPGVVEEIVFRGVLLRRLLLSYAPKLSLVVSSLAFGLFHPDLVHTPATFLMGIYLGTLYLHRGRLSYCIAAHALNNFCAVIGAELELSQIDHVGIVLGGGLVAYLSTHYYFRGRLIAD